MSAVKCFTKIDDIAALVNLMREAHEKVPMRLTGFSLKRDSLLQSGLKWPR